MNYPDTGLILAFRLIWITLLTSSLLACQTTLPQPEPEPVIEAIVVEPPIDQNRLNYEAALEDLKSNQFKSAIEELEYLSNTAADLEYIFTNLGLAYINTENYKGAEQAFQRAISQNNSDVVAYNHLGIISRMQGRFDKARLAYEEAIDIDPEYAQAYLNLGILYDIYLQDLKRALIQYQTYQTLTDSQDKTVGRWILDIKRRLQAS
ncbi:MAG: tetratricopeptide repeat protein [Gammaproteobacteria bacterium]|nr:tetratricopeptide repeat protein [Gammaproteobacteria bacterium]